MEISTQTIWWNEPPTIPQMVECSTNYGGLNIPQLVENPTIFRGNIHTLFGGKIHLMCKIIPSMNVSKSAYLCRHVYLTPLAGYATKLFLET